jgi:hypothetical protein
VIPDFHKQLKRHICIGHRQNDLLDVVRFPSRKILDDRIGRQLVRIGLFDELVDEVAKGAFSFGPAGGSILRRILKLANLGDS